MVRGRNCKRSLFEVLLPDGDKLWPEDLRRVDALLDDEQLVEQVAEALRSRWPQSRRRGRPGTPAEVVLRMLLLKHLYGWSYDVLEQEVRANLVYREFARVGDAAVPDAKTILKIARSLGPEVIEGLHRRVVELAILHDVSRGRRMRIDTTVVETNVHYPTDSSLLADGVRVLTRIAKRIEELVGAGRRQFRDRLRSVGRCYFSILQQARRPGGDLKSGYRRLLGITRAVVRDAETMSRRVAQRRRLLAEKSQRTVDRLTEKLRTTRTLVGRVIEQTRQRVFAGDTRVPDKVLSLFEPHTEAIRKGKVVKPTEFGKLVAIQEAENGIISAYTVCEKRPADRTLWEPALEAHEQCFGRAPYLVAADRGFWSTANEQAAVDRGVRRVVLPRVGSKSAARRKHERQRWFRRGQRWRVGSEGRISVIKRRHKLDRCLYHGEDGVQRWVGLGVIANNLLSTAAQVAQVTARAP